MAKLSTKAARDLLSFSDLTDHEIRLLTLLLCSVVPNTANGKVCYSILEKIETLKGASYIDEVLEGFITIKVENADGDIQTFNTFDHDVGFVL